MKSDGCLVLHYQRVHQQQPQEQVSLSRRRIGITGSASSLPLPSPAGMTPLQQPPQPPSQQQLHRRHRRASSRSGRTDDADTSRRRSAPNDDHESMSTSSSSSPSSSSSLDDDDDENDNHNDGEGNDSITISSASASSTNPHEGDNDAPRATSNRNEGTRTPPRPAFPPFQGRGVDAGGAQQQQYQTGRGSLVRKRSCSTISESVSAQPLPPILSSAVAHLTASSASPSTASSPSSPAHSPSSSNRPIVVINAAQQLQPPKQPPHPPLSTDHDMALLADSNRASEAAQAAQQRHRLVLFRRLEASAPMGKLSLINLARQGIGPAEARLLGDAIRINPHLSVLKLAYNHLGNDGAEAIAEALGGGGGGELVVGLEKGGTSTFRHHDTLSVLDVGFNDIGDAGCEALAVRVVAGNYKIRTLCLTANCISARGALAIAGSIMVGTGLSRLLLAANPIRSRGLEAIATAIVKHDTQQIASLTASVASSLSTPVAQPLVAVKGMVELDVGSTSIDSPGFMTIPAMLITNATLQTLCLENNNIDDNDMALLSQSLSQNKNVPLRTLKLSFNQISCAGVECLMNAVWGSPTLRDLSLDNNKIQDRGAQLCAVVLTSIALERLDLSFNRVTTVGLKALMKNISENSSMQTLGFSGIPIDLNGSKAVSFALAYNSSLRAVYLDNCSTGYSSQRHIVAGIVSNRRSSLRVLTGFAIGPVARTLGMPNLPESWSNDQVLGFFRLMWQQWLLKSGRGVAPRQEDDAVRGPAPPAAVAAAAKITLSAIAVGTSSGMDALFHTEAHEKPVAEGPPVETTASALLERTDSGTMRVPSFPNALVIAADDDAPVEFVGPNRLPERNAVSPGPGLSTVRGPLENPERRNRNLQWLRQHFRSLGEVGRLPFSNADLWQLHQYYFSPPFAAADETDDSGGGGRSTSRSPYSSASPTSGEESAAGFDRPSVASPLSVVAPPPTPAFGMSVSRSGADSDSCSPPRMGRAVSFQALGDAFAASGFATTGTGGRSSASSSSTHALHHKRRSGRRAQGRRAIHEDDDEEEDEAIDGNNSGRKDINDDDDDGPALKRVKGVGKPRIAYYPRVMAKIQALGTKPMDQSLSLLRQLKYAENVIFSGRDPYAGAVAAASTSFDAGGGGGGDDASSGSATASASGGVGGGGTSSSPWSTASSTPPSRPLQRRGSEDMDEEDVGLAHSDVEMILLDLL